MAPVSRRSVSPVTTIIFDLDNTLIETRNGDTLAAEKVNYLLTHQYGFTQDTATQVTQKFLRKFRKCPENISYDLDAWRLLLWQNALGSSCAHLADEIYPQWLDLRYECLTISPDVSALLQELRHDYYLAVITNGPSKSQWEKINRLKLRPYFDCILVSGDLPWEKPNIKIFQQACLHLAVTPQNCIMVGDKLDTDILGAIEASLYCNVWIPLIGSTEIICNIKPDFIINNIIELKYLVPFKKSQTRNVMDIDIEDCNSNSSDGS